jgi:hypothetical protein
MPFKVRVCRRVYNGCPLVWGNRKNDFKVVIVSLFDDIDNSIVGRKSNAWTVAGMRAEIF